MALGITLNSTEGLLNEVEFIRASGLTQIARYRKQGLIKPVGRGTSGTKISFFYHSRQITELKSALGITLDSTEGLLTEENFMKASGLSSVRSYRKQGLIKPVGYAVTSGSGVTPYYDPRQIKELKNALGITLDNTDGLLIESAFVRMSGLTNVARYRKQGLITPAGKAMSGTAISFFYHPRQINELKTALGITLDCTEGLLNETEFMRMSGRTMIPTYRRRGIIKEVGFAMTKGGRLSAFYHPRQIVELTQRLAKLKGAYCERQTKG